jgi:hypothetical protein
VVQHRNFGALLVEIFAVDIDFHARGAARLRKRPAARNPRVERKPVEPEQGFGEELSCWDASGMMSSRLFSRIDLAGVAGQSSRRGFAEATNSF